MAQHQQGPSANLPNSSEVIEALSNPDLYDQLSARFAQSTLQPDDVFKKDSSDDTCGTRPVCPAYEGRTETINGREYNLYCINAPKDATPYIWDNGYAKIGAIPVSNQPTAFPPAPSARSPPRQPNLALRPLQRIPIQDVLPQWLQRPCHREEE
ncbi:MAG: hypothetical protein L6R38_008343 [Xanthoria sp. 2 TBL-2021]|nr:MAG: hypothetical protein L6R38_008343 [Xanthoria sp. 2 TBL-2021]